MSKRLNAIRVMISLNSLSLSLSFVFFKMHHSQKNKPPNMPQPTLHPFLRPGITLVWAKALGFAMIHGFALLMGVTLLLPPAPMLRALVEEEVSTFTFLGRSNVAVIICDSTKKRWVFLVVVVQQESITFWMFKR